MPSIARQATSWMGAVEGDRIIDAAIVGARIVDAKIIDGKIVGGRIIGGQLIGDATDRTATIRARTIDSDSTHAAVIAALGLGLVLLATHLL